MFVMQTFVILTSHCMLLNAYLVGEPHPTAIYDDLQSLMEDQIAFYLEVGRKIRAAREDRGLTQDALASLVSLTRTSITNIEKGRQKLLLHTLVDVAVALNIPPLKLLPDNRPESGNRAVDQLLKSRSPKERAWVRSALNLSKKGK